MGKRFLHNRAAVITVAVVLLIALMGLLAPVLAPHDPYATDILNKFAPYSLEYPLGTDHLGRCVLSRLIYGIRPTLGLALLTMLGTIALGAALGIMAGYFRGVVEEVIMRVVDVMLSFPSQIMVFAVVGLLGINVQNVIIANVFIKWAWYARMIRTGVMQYRERNFIQFSRCVGMPERFILFRHLLPSITSDLAVLASLDVGWAIINISTLSFLGLGVQAPTPEWGAMLNEAKEVLTSNPTQMIAPGIAIVALVCCFNLMGEALLEKSGEELRRLRGGRVGIVLQNPMTCFDPLYRVGDQIAESFAAHNSWSGEEIRRRSLELLEKMRIRSPEEVLEKYPHQLSGGMLQRIMIGIATAMEPALLIADEPTTAIDAITQYEILNEFLRVKQENQTAMVFISHDLNAISRVADRIVVLNQGRVVDEGDFQHILHHAQDLYTRLLVEKRADVMRRYRQVLVGKERDYA